MATWFCVTDDLFKVHKLKPNVKWRQAFDGYLKTLPPYYLIVCICVCTYILTVTDDSCHKK